MTKRYRHVMSRANGDAQPACLVGLTLETHLEAVGTNGKLERNVMDRWYASRRILGNGRQQPERSSSGSTVGEFWRWLKSVATVRGTVLIGSLACMDHWALLGFWEGIEHGKIQLIGQNQNGRTDTGSKVSELLSRGTDSCGMVRRQQVLSVPHLSRGILVTEDPPTIAYFFIRGCNYLVRWVDVRNYGISTDSLTGTRAEISRKIVGFIGDMVGCLTSRGLGSLKDTAAAQSLFSFRRKHLHTAIYCHTVKPVLDMEREAYYSGRCECGHIGHVEGPIYEFDIRGSYHYAMLRCPVPCRLVRYQIGTATGEVPELGTTGGFIGDVTLSAGTPDYPVRRESLTIYPVGTFRTQLCGPELYDAMERGRVKKWHGWAEYECEPALSRFAEEVYQIRCAAEDTGDKLIASWAKSLAVSLVGKLGQRGHGWEWLPDRKPYNWYDQYYEACKDGIVRRHQEIAGKHRREMLSGWNYDSVPAIAGWIASSARLRLLGMLRVCGLHNCYYMDTDSLFVSEEGAVRLYKAGYINPGELGFLQAKGLHQWIEIRGIKSYRTPAVARMAGIPGSGKGPVLAAEGLRQSVFLSTYLSLGYRPSSWRTIVAKGPLQPYRHGTIVAGGKVVPLVVSDE